MVDVLALNNPTLLSSKASVNPDTEPTVYFLFCERLSLGSGFADLNCPNATDMGDLYAMSVSASSPPVCTALSTTSLTSITNSTWVNEAD